MKDISLDTVLETVERVLTDESAPGFTGRPPFVQDIAV
jgi:hypothetical protein